MFPRLQHFGTFLTVAAFIAILVPAGATARAQRSGFNLALHANSNASAAQIGLPAYPGATPYKQDPKSDATANLGFTFGDFHFGLLAAEYQTSDSPAQVMAFYRKPLARYGEVLECRHGKPIGTLKETPGGLTCSDQHDGHIQVNGSTNSSNDYELRAGSPHKFRIVGIDDSRKGWTHFGLVKVELPNDTNGSLTTD